MSGLLFHIKGDLAIGIKNSQAKKKVIDIIQDKKKGWA